MTEAIEIILAGVACIAAILGLLWLTIRIVRHAWGGSTAKAYTVEAAVEKVRIACKELRNYYPGAADNFAHGLAAGLFEAQGLNTALILALQKLDSGDVSGAKEEIARIQLWYTEAMYMVEQDRRASKNGTYL